MCRREMLPYNVDIWNVLSMSIHSTPLLFLRKVVFLEESEKTIAVPSFPEPTEIYQGSRQILFFHDTHPFLN